MNASVKQLLQSLLDAARSDEPARHADLLKQLESPEVLDGLDSEEDYANSAKFRLRVQQVLEALARNPAPTARSTFLALTRSEAFTAHDERIMSLVRASVSICPAPPALVAFWDTYSQPEDGFTPSTITVLIDNGSPPALDLFERKMADPTHEDDDKTAWMRTRVLSHRNDVALLLACERLLQRGLPEHLRPLLVDVLFDYRPGEWFRPASSVSAPPLESASPEALDHLLKIGVLALTKVRLSEEQRSVVTLRSQRAETLRDQWPR